MKTRIGLRMAVLIVSVLAIVLMVGGCDLTPQERVEKVNQAIGTIRQASAVYDQTTTGLAEPLARGKELLRDPNLPAGQMETLIGYIEKTEREISAIAQKKVAADAEIARLQAMTEKILAGGEVDMQQELQGYNEIILSLAPFMGKFGPIVILGSGLANILLGLFFKKKTAEVKQGKVTAADIVQSVSQLISVIDQQDHGKPDTILTAKDAKLLLADKQNTSTYNAVQSILAAGKKVTDDPAVIAAAL
jgi:hypothetical protein